MLENRWSRRYLDGLLERSGHHIEDLTNLIEGMGLEDVQDPLLEIAFLRYSNSPALCLRYAVAALSQCREDAPVGLVADLIETVEYSRAKLSQLEDDLPLLRLEAVDEPQSGEKLAKLGFALAAIGERDKALSAYTQALEHTDSLCIHCHRDCLVNIGWNHYIDSEFEQALGWFEIAAKLVEPIPEELDDGFTEDPPGSQVPYRLALENVLLTLTKLGRFPEAALRLEQYHSVFGRLPTYESAALQQLGLDADLIYIRSRIQRNSGGASA